MSWSLVSFATGSDVGLGILRSDGNVVVPPALKQWPTVLELLDDWPNARAVLPSIEIEDAEIITYEDLLAPIRWPRKVVCAGVNYQHHIQEMGGEIPTGEWKPFFFLKPPTTTVIGPHDSIVLHSPDVAKYDWEAELAAVIGIGGRDIPVGRALNHVAGYCVANDISARGHHKRTAVPAAAFTYDWFASKSIDKSLPLGPGITPAFLINDPQQLHIRLWVNGALRQDESTADMICSVAELVAAASGTVTLEPGDVIATGTPSGVGGGQGLFLQAGDVVRTEISGLGALENSVVAAAPLPLS
ncbi:fumarylacetoacetate hydrolase family protein [uncultured Mycobacterium sp.]|uniref:fumarylacetoacetate hydrolase family protein n=1 Tax=uncultured Mycobacterium sp. TaxID=171292 RepID=UPI0035CA78D8